MKNPIRSREMYLAYHQIKTAMYGLAVYDSISEALKKGLPENFRKKLNFGLEYHDISKTLEHGWTEGLLFSTRHPTREEWLEVIKPHPVQSAAAFLRMGIKDMSVIDIAEFHHVRFDGVSFVDVDEDGRTVPPYAGYPRGVVGANLSLGPRIAKLADSVCAMDEDRPYRSRKIPMPEIMENVKGRAGTEYDPALAAAFCATPLDALLGVSRYRIPKEKIEENIETRMSGAVMSPDFT